MGKKCKAIDAAVQEYLHVTKLHGWSDDQRLAGRSATRGVMMRLNVYTEFCDQLEAANKADGTVSHDEGSL